MDIIQQDRTVILIIDDNPVNRRFVENLLRKKGYLTATARNGASGLDLARKRKPDLILLDIYMPAMSGIEVCKALKEDPKTREIPVIFVTVNTDNDVLTQAFEAGGTDYVRKPINRVELLARIRSALVQRMWAERMVEEERMKALLEMAGAVCHEMNQPLQVILGYSGLFLNLLEKEHPLHKPLGIVREEILKMGEITKKLLEITQYRTRDYTKGQRILDLDRSSQRS